MDVKTVKNAVRDGSDSHHAAIMEILASLQKYKTVSLVRAVGLKVLDQQSLAEYQTRYANLDIKSKRELLQMILVDDLGSIAKTALQFVGPKVA